MLTSLAFLLSLAHAQPDLPPGITCLEPDPAWPRVKITGTLDRPESLAELPLHVAASVDKATPFHGRYLAVVEVTPDDGFELALPAPPEGVHLWALATDTGGMEDQGFHQLYNHYPLVIPSDGLHGVHFTMADYRLTYEGVDPFGALVAPWWWLYGAAALGLLLMLAARRLGRSGRGQRLPRLPPLDKLPRESAWVAALLLLAVLFRVPSLGESLSMTEFVHAQIAARSHGLQGGYTALLLQDVPSCDELCAAVAGEPIPGCEPACIAHFGSLQPPRRVASCALGDQGTTDAQTLLACLTLGEAP